MASKVARQNKKEKETMAKPLILELKALLSYILNSDNKPLREKTLAFAMTLLSEIEMDWRPAERALKEELLGHRKEADALIEKILDAVDKEEYAKT